MTIFPQRKSIRFKNYDYSLNGLYFTTICTQNRKCLFGDIVDGKMVLNGVGEILKNIWQSLPDHHSVELDTFQIMPNHVHFIIQIVVGATRGSPGLTRGLNTTGAPRHAPTLGTIIGLFKSECTKQIRKKLNNPNIIVWQRNYYECILRNEKSLNKIREYIKTNPKIWDRDRNNPENWKKIR
ncbi:transposase [Patescibacteria group bacterium]|nr:transposase [Patescibacteria group bacterium]